MMKKFLLLIPTACLCLTLAGCFANATRSPAATQVPSRPAETAAPEETTMPVGETTRPSEPIPEPTLPLEVPEPAEDAFVPVSRYLPGVYVELKYASDDNFTGGRVYEFQEAYLRYGTVKKLMDVQAELETMGLGLKLWDGFRPVSAQFRLWEICPDPAYVANPEKGYSSHSRGNTVDLTLVDSAGNELEMPTAFDDFSSLADRDYSDCTVPAAENAILLQTVMEKHGFSGYFGEWWHYTDVDGYEVSESFLPVRSSRWYADCREFISLRCAPSVDAAVITRIPVQEEFDLLAWCAEFAYVDYQGFLGYVLSDYIQELSP